ncbi:TetR/AcrR family transcriptional regulator [Saccharothrix variisporea]|uniref:TetR family transcriptional regulator n=1 Tax=Saccharothrix variisporea TaxID=543527 RepID=A0A495XAK1_9PSEU|nr:TetR family transcriptional regulator [Saccharothrix variisporea]RKT71032.1 TetR family transcriptional regulator [Saccharothrix variisporea]
MTDLTRSLLDAAAALLAVHGSRGLRMVDVATRAAVSRQTVYNAFGNKESLVRAVALDKTAQFLAGVQERLAADPDPLNGLHTAVAFVFEEAARDPLAHSVFSGANAEDMLPLVTTRGHEILGAAAEVFASHATTHWPHLPTDRRTLIGETTVRLVLSHLLTPSGDPAAAVVAVTRALLT